MYLIFTLVEFILNVYNVTNVKCVFLLYMWKEDQDSSFFFSRLLHLAT